MSGTNSLRVSRRRHVWVWTCVVCVTLVANVTQGQMSSEDFGRLLPSGANVVGVVRVAEILKSDRAVQENWEQQQEERFLAGAAALPPHIETLVIGKLVHPTVPNTAWSASLIPFPAGASMASIAERSGTRIEQLSGKPSIRSQRGAYVTEVQPGLAAVFAPALRQDAARWVQSIGDKSSGRLSTYLVQALTQKEHLILAMDLRDAIDPGMLEKHLREDSRFRQQAALVERLVPLLVGVQGITLTLNVGQKIDCRVTLEFADEVGSSGFSVKAVLLSSLEDLGASIEEFTPARVDTMGRQVTLTCELSDASFRRILTLVALPPTPTAALTAAPPVETEPAPTPEKRVDPEKATRAYIAAVNKMIDDLQSASRRGRDYARTAMWHDNFAARIESLNTSGVADDALAYGAAVADAFRALGSSLRGQGVEVNAAQNTLVYQTQFTPGWASVNIWGGVGYGQSAVNVTSNLQQVREQQAAAVVAGSRQRDQIWTMIQNSRADMARRYPAR